MNKLRMGLWALLVAFGGMAPALADEPAVVEEEPLFFDVTFGPQVQALVPLGTSSAAGLLGFEATRYVAWPVYLGAAAYGGAHFGPSGVGVVGYGGPKLGLLLRLSGYALEPGVLAGAVYAGGPTATGVGPVVQPDLTVHFYLGEDFILRLGAGYLFSTSVAGLSGPTVRLGYSF